MQQQQQSCVMSRNLQQYNGKCFPEPTLFPIIQAEGSLFSAQPDGLACHVVRHILSSSFHGTNIWDAVELLLLLSPLFEGSEGEDAGLE